MTQRPFIRYALGLALLASAQAVAAMPARQAAQLRAESCCARMCHRARAASCATRCCLVDPASSDVVTLAASSELRAQTTAGASTPATYGLGSTLDAPAGPGLTAPQRAGPLFLRLRSLRL